MTTPPSPSEEEAKEVEDLETALASKEQWLLEELEKLQTSPDRGRRGLPVEVAAAWWFQVFLEEETEKEEKEEEETEEEASVTVQLLFMMSLLFSSSRVLSPRLLVITTRLGVWVSSTGIGLCCLLRFRIQRNAWFDNGSLFIHQSTVDIFLRDLVSSSDLVLGAAEEYKKF